jgi:D-lactate dehydrogenase
MRRGVTIVNTGRGALLDTAAVVRHLKTGHVGALALDVYEEEGPLFFEDHSSSPIRDDIFARLLTFPNVVVTGHQGFFTVEALSNIATTTLSNLDDIAAGRQCVNQVVAS